MSHSLWSNIRTLKSQERQRSWSQDLQSPRSETYFTISRWQQSCESWVFILSLKITSCKNQVLFSTFQMWRFQYQRGKNSLRWRQDSIWTRRSGWNQTKTFLFCCKTFQQCNMFEEDVLLKPFTDLLPPDWGQNFCSAPESLQGNCWKITTDIRQKKL